MRRAGIITSIRPRMMFKAHSSAAQFLTAARGILGLDTLFISTCAYSLDSIITLAQPWSLVTSPIDKSATLPRASPSAGYPSKALETHI